MQTADDTESDIRNLTIQGATNVALTILEALKKTPDKDFGMRVANARPTEPLAQNAVRYIFSGPDTLFRINQYKTFILQAQKTIPESGKNLLANGGRYLTLCHSTTAVSLLVAAQKNGVTCSVYVAETRPLYQGRTTATDLLSNGLDDVTMVTDSVAFALLENKKFDAVLLGADLLTETGFVNKVGSLAAATIANIHTIPVYCVSTLLKFNPTPFIIEQRSPDEIWEHPPKSLKFYAPAFDYVPYYPNVRIVCEEGVIPGKNVGLAVKKRYSFIIK